MHARRNRHLPTHSTQSNISYSIQLYFFIISFENNTLWCTFSLSFAYRTSINAIYDLNTHFFTYNGCLNLSRIFSWISVVFRSAVFLGSCPYLAAEKFAFCNIEKGAFRRSAESTRKYLPLWTQSKQIYERNLNIVRLLKMRARKPRDRNCKFYQKKKNRLWIK